MIEAKERKSAFLREVIRTLALENTDVATQRFEDAAMSTEYAGRGDLVTVRAVKATPSLFDTAGRLLRNGGHLLWFRPAHEPSADPIGFQRTATVLLLESPKSFLSVYRRVFHVEHSAERR
jgi:hypothetical protein